MSTTEEYRGYRCAICRGVARYLVYDVQTPPEPIASYCAQHDPRDLQTRTRRGTIGRDIARSQME